MTMRFVYGVCQGRVYRETMIHLAEIAAHVRNKMLKATNMYIYNYYIRPVSDVDEDMLNEHLI